MATEAPHPPARGIERALCWFVIAVLSVQFVVTLVVAVVSPEFVLHWMYIVAPPIVVLIGVGRLKGWIKPRMGRGGVR